MTAAPYGVWSSPITAEAITKNSVTIAEILVDPVTSTIYHIENRPSEGGRGVVVNTATGRDVTHGKDWNFRSGVNGYGGAAAIVQDGVVYFSHYGDGRVYRVREGDEPEGLTPEKNKAHRFAGFAIHPVHTHLLVSILEDHTIDRPAEIVNTLCLINTRTKLVKSIIVGADFYASPKFSSDGSRLAWQQWSLPDMPWHGAEIHVADAIVDLGSDSLFIENDIKVAGQPRKISCGFPSWVSNDTLIFTSDESGFINPWKYTNGKAGPLFPEPVAQEFGSPLHDLHIMPYAIVNKYAVFTAKKDGRDTLYISDLEGSAEPQYLDTPYVVIENLRSVSREAQEVVFVGQKVDEKSCIVRCTISISDDGPQATFTVLKSAESKAFPKELVSIPQSMTIDAPSGEGPLHLVYYAPKNPKYSGSSIEGERPPCVLNVHGGPTALAMQGLDWKKQYFTSRGWAWLDVNHGGSSGYGRAYTQRLDGKWGIVEVEECVHAARVISSAPYNFIDPKRIAIRGGSAGGWTALCALSYGPDLRAFAAATALYGISDLKPLAEQSHKFEYKYMETLIGDEANQELYRERSPLYNANKIVSPLLLLHGDMDTAVPVEQTEKIYESIKARGGHVEKKIYSQEGHGFRREETIKDALQMEIQFYEQVFRLGKNS